MEQDEVFRIRRAYQLLGWLLLFLLVASTLALVIFVAVAMNGQGYINLDIVSFCFLLAGFFWVVWASYSYRQTTSVQLLDNGFVLQKAGQKQARYPYSAIIAHNERRNHYKTEWFNELTVYITDNWFAIRSSEYEEYDYLKAQLTRYGQPVPYRDAITPAERNRLRWFISGMAFLILLTIGFGFVLHNPADPNPARLVSVTDVVDRVRVSRNKNRPDGTIISLRAFPNFTFYVSPGNYDVRINDLQSAITPNQPITLLIRQSEFRKKLRRTEPLTFGDKYDDYSRIMVFGVNQGDSVDIMTPGPVYEPTHTNPLLRAFLLSILLLCCWTGWVYVDRQPQTAATIPHPLAG